MALAKKGWRKLIVEDVPYFWRVKGGQPSGYDDYHSVMIVTANAFVSGSSAQKLFFWMDFWLTHGTTQSRLKITPCLIRLAIEKAKKADPAFTGGFGVDDVALCDEDREALASQARAHRLTTP